MRINSSNLALRFYASEGWTLDLLNSFVEKGAVKKHPSFDKDEKEGWGGYFIPEPGTKMNIPKLMKLVTSVHRAFNDYPEDTDEQFIKKMLW
jgi:hypothetical protein